MDNDFNRLRCPVCGRFYKNKDKVFLEEFNTVKHQRCYHNSNGLAIIDKGTYLGIVMKYDFFHGLLD